MKNIIFIFSLLVLSTARSQDASGEINYTTKVNVHKNIPDTERGLMIKSMIPEFRTVENVLIFNETESIYGNKKIEKSDEDLLEEDDGNSHWRMRWDRPDEIFYTNLETNEVIRQKDLMGKMFLIKDTIDQTMWKINGEQKLVSGLNCMRAEYFDVEDSVTVVAWFTSQIPVSTGPAGFGGLPGLIVYLDINDGGIVISASNIALRPLEKKEIKAPSKGKVVTQAEYDEIEQKKIQQMREQYGGRSGGGHWRH